MEKNNEKSEPIVKKDIVGKVGHLTLNSPKTLNSLNEEMIEELYGILKKWEKDPNIQVVLLEGAGGKAFCAGGDVVALYKAMKSLRETGGPDPRKDGPIYHFFTKEYKLDYYIHIYPKPIVVIGDGIVMGGGMGIMNGAKFRLVTEKTMMAMPEITIGLYPDVGGSYFLNQMPEGAALFLALTGNRFNGKDALDTNMADYFIAKEKIPELRGKIFSEIYSKDKKENASLVEEICLGMMEECKELIPQGQVKDNLEEIQHLTNFETIQELYHHWQNYQSQNPWIQKGINLFVKGSPTSAAVIFEQIKRGKELTLEEAFKNELIMSIHFSLKHDFMEGVRALLIDKDQTPKWSPNEIGSVDKNLVNEHFKNHWNDSSHPLEGQRS